MVFPQYLTTDYIFNLVQVPYKWGGRDRSGLDCYGLVYLIYKEVLNIELQDYVLDTVKKYNDLENTDIISSRNTWKKIEEKDLRCFDCVLYCLKGSSTPNHIAMYLGDGQIIHALEDAGIVCIKKRNFRFNVYSYYRYV